MISARSFSDTVSDSLDLKERLKSTQKNVKERERLALYEV